MFGGRAVQVGSHASSALPSSPGKYTEGSQRDGIQDAKEKVSRTWHQGDARTSLENDPKADRVALLKRLQMEITFGNGVIGMMQWLLLLAMVLVLQTRPSMVCAFRSQRPQVLIFFIRTSPMEKTYSARVNLMRVLHADGDDFSEMRTIPELQVTLVQVPTLLTAQTIGYQCFLLALVHASASQRVETQRRFGKDGGRTQQRMDSANPSTPLIVPTYNLDARMWSKTLLCMQEYIKQLSADFKTLMISSSSYFDKRDQNMHFILLDQVYI